MIVNLQGPNILESQIDFRWMDHLHHSDVMRLQELNRIDSVKLT